jgi:hypothetical protein
LSGHVNRFYQVDKTQFPKDFTEPYFLFWYILF